jgi:hypothetical protein
MWFSRCVLLLLEAGSWSWGPFENPDERERPPLETATKQGLVNALTWEEQVCSVVICDSV